MSVIVRSVQAVGSGAMRVVVAVGRAGYLAVDALRAVRRIQFWGPHLLPQMARVGVESVPIAIFIATFTGIVLALQASYTFTGAVPLYFVGTLVGKTMVLELGPVLTGLALSGRVGANIAAEMGTMRVTEQIDALVSLATDPVQYLFVPRVLAGILVVPMLVVLADVTGIVGGYLVAVAYLGANPVVYVENTFQFLDMEDLTSGLIKAAAFGGLLTLIGCQSGFDTRGGAEGVGRSTTAAVVLGSLAILIADFFLTKVLF